MVGQCEAHTRDGGRCRNLATYLTPRFCPKHAAPPPPADPMPPSAIGAALQRAREQQETAQ